jgi:uncharacterized protein YajQ (UPF0234 family)
MASNHTFDIVNEIDLQAMDEAIVQARREIDNRYDFRGSAAGIGDFDRKEKLLTLTADHEPQLDAVIEVLISKMVKRGVDSRVLDRQKIEAATHKTLRQVVKLKSGIDRDNAKTLQQRIKDLGLKVNVSIQGETLRVAGPKIDDLQAIIAEFKARPPAVPVQFTNFR